MEKAFYNAEMSSFFFFFNVIFFVFCGILVLKMAHGKGKAHMKVI